MKKPARLAGSQYTLWRSALGVWLAERRREVGLTQEEVAEAIGTRSGAVSALECGRMPVPMDRYRALATVLKVPERSFAKVLLRLTDAGLFQMLYGSTPEIEAELRRVGKAPRVTKAMQKAHRAGSEQEKREPCAPSCV